MNLHSKQQQPARLGRKVAASAMAALLCVSGNSAWSNPLGAQVISGQASMATVGNQLTITNTPGAILQWQGFSINAGEVTRFVQQSAQSTVLNRVVGQDPSQILGALQSNGKVFLINPNGIVFGAGAQVDVNGLVASSLKLGNEDFLAGKLNLGGDGEAGAVQNHGAITTPSGGQVYLIAPNVSNTGIITSPGGAVILAAGRSVKLADSADPNLHVVVSAANDQALNIGSVVAQGGKVGIYGALIQQRGVVNATSAVRGENGRVVFRSSGDASLSAGSVTSTSGGDIAISAGNALTVDGSVSSGGGAIRLSGERVHVGAGVDAGAGQLTINRTANTRANDEPPPAVEVPPPPTLDQCIASPSLTGCSSVLPGMSACVENPSQAGCSVVLPSLGTCMVSPSLAGCSVVLPTLSACTLSPALAGCSVVLPSLSACVAAPSLAGCLAVLPSVNSCIAAPTVPGCSAVLPSLSACAVSPSLVGCSVVLPSLSACMAAPSALGCNAVLPTLSACVVSPSQAGCAVVLPSLSMCIASPILPGCSVVLPTLGQCTAAPTLAGCAAVLPSVSACVSNPTAPGCVVVVPTTLGSVPEPVFQSLNSTVNIINTVTSTMFAASVGSDITGGPTAPDGPGAKKDDKEDKQIFSKDMGVDKDAVKKTFCN